MIREGNMIRGIVIVNGKSEGLELLGGNGQQFGANGMDISVVPFERISVTSGDEADGVLYIDGERVPLPDFVAVTGSSIGNGYPYQLMAVLRMLNARGVVCINPYEAIEKTRDKMYSLQLAKEAVPEVLVPRTMLVTGSTKVEQIESFIGYPMVLKIMHGSMGKGVTMVKDRGALENLLDIVTATEFGDQLIAQQAITTSKGRDLRVMLSAGRFLHAFVRCSDSGFKSNVHQGGHVEEFEVPQSLKETSERIAKAFGLRMGSVDYLFGEGPEEFYLCEVNSAPGIGFPGYEKIMAESIGRILSEEGLI